MEEKKNNKGLVWLMIILIVLMLTLVGFKVYDKFLKVDKIIPENKITTTATTTTTTQSQTNNKFYKMNKKEVPKFHDYIDYPVFLGQDISIKSLNEKISDNIDEIIQDINELEGEIINNSEENNYDSCLVEKYDDSRKKVFCAYDSLSYHVFENEKYLSVVEYDHYIRFNASGNQLVREIYTIDKNTEKIITSEEIINSLDNLSILKTDLNNYVKNNYDSFIYFSEIDKTQFLNELSNLLNQNDFKIYFDNESIIFYFDEIQDFKSVLFSYNKNNSWEDSITLNML